MTFLVSIQFGGSETDEYIVAESAAAAVAQVRASLPARVARWANVFVA